MQDENSKKTAGAPRHEVPVRPGSPAVANFQPQFMWQDDTTGVDLGDTGRMTAYFEVEPITLVSDPAERSRPSWTPATEQQRQVVEAFEALGLSANAAQIVKWISANLGCDELRTDFANGDPEHHRVAVLISEVRQRLSSW